MKKYFTRFMAVVCCLVCSLTANAQYSKVFEQYPRTNYATDAVNWKLSEIAAALDTDAATLASELANINTDLFYMEGTENLAYNEGANGYYLDLEAKKCDWGDENSRWFVSPRWSEEDDTFGFVCGQHSDRLKGGEETGIVTLVLALNDKKVTFAISLKIKSLNIPETTNALSELNIIQKLSAEMHQYARSSDYSEADTIDFKGIAEELGTNPETFSVGISKIVFATTLDADNPEEVKGDLLTNVPTYGSTGWWFDTSQDTPLYSTFVAKENGVFSVDGFALDPETEELIFNVGQKGGALPIDGSDYDLGVINEVSTPIYFVFDGKAVELTVKLIIDEREKVPFSEMTEVGSEDINLSQYPTSDYTAISFTVDLDSIAGLLEVDATEITLWAPLAADEITDESSAGNQGFWFNMDGYRASWGSGCGIFVENPTSGDYSRFNVGQYPNAYEGGETGIATLYFVAGSKYYTVHVNMSILIKEGPIAEFQSVATRAVNIQIIPSGSYDVEMTYTIDANDFELIGTTSPTLYGRKNPSDGSEWTDGYTDTYTCTPYPGFWMSKEGYPRGWNTSADDYSPWGVTFADDLFTFYQMPNRNQVGDEFNAVLYLVNVTTGKMITYNFTVKFVSSITPQAEVVAQKSLTLPVKNDSETSTPLDVADVLEKIGFTEATQIFAVPTLSALTADGNMSDPANAAGGVWITSEGVLDSDPDGNNAAIGLLFSSNGEKEIIATVYDMVGGWDADTKIVSKFGFQNDSKLYIFNVTFISEDVYTGIRETKTANTDATLYDLSGRRVKKAQQGVFIQGGKKLVVK